MPEEKVTLKNSRFPESYQNVEPPAADAGPRQCSEKLNGDPPPRCRLKEGHSGEHESPQPGGILYWAATPVQRKHQCPSCGEEYALGVECDLCAPPVPQEAAPDFCKLCGERRSHSSQHTCTKCGNSFLVQATAPDSAMRVARECLADCGMDTEAWDRIYAERWAALIRQAGSARERELEEKLQWAVNWISHGRGRTRCIICDHLVGGHSPGCEVAEASRLLGGEA